MKKTSWQKDNKQLRQGKLVFWARNSLVLLFVLVLTGCMGGNRQESKEVRFLRKAHDAFAQRDFETALPYLNYLKKSPQAHDRLQKLSLFYLGLSHYHLWEFKKAREYFDRFDKKESGLLPSLIQNPLSPANLASLTRILRLLMDGSYERARSVIHEFLSEEQESIAVRMMHYTLNHAIFVSRACEEYYLLDKAFRRALKESGHEKAQTRSRRPIYAFAALDCLLMNHHSRRRAGDNGDEAQQKDWRAKGVGLIKKIKGQPLPEHYELRVVNTYKELFEGNYSKARKEARRLWDRFESPETLDLLARILYHGGKQRRLRQLLADNKGYFSESVLDQYNYASYLAMAGAKGQALKALQQAIDSGFRDLAHLMADPDLEPLRRSEGFYALLNRYFPKRDKPFRQK